MIGSESKDVIQAEYFLKDGIIHRHLVLNGCEVEYQNEDIITDLDSIVGKGSPCSICFESSIYDSKNI
jgi:hypothetical protein